MLKLKDGLEFADLYDREGLKKVDALFLSYLLKQHPDLAARLIDARLNIDSMNRSDESTLIIDLATYVETFLTSLLDIAEEVEALAEQHDAAASYREVKRDFVQRHAVKRYPPNVAAAEEGDALSCLLHGLFGEPVTEKSFACHVSLWLRAEEANRSKLDIAARYAAWASQTEAGKRRHKHGILFKIPRKIDPSRMIETETLVHGSLAKLQISAKAQRERDGFDLTDPGMNLIDIIDQANYCIWCHKQQKDSCSRGLMERRARPEDAPDFKRGLAGVTLAGCPLQVKISEMNLVKANGNSIGALAVIVVDNPMLAATGHRICNDCMKSCIYQKQDPVEIPQIETRILKDVLALPYGFEIYSLLTRWNPLNLRRSLPKPETRRKVLVVGLGPAGFTLSHHLINDGHSVVAIDGLKLEPLPGHLSGIDDKGVHVPFEPIKDVTLLYEALDKRIMAGFGGVAEYGITIRWNKNYLKLVRLLLERRRQFDRFGGIRFGGTLTIDGAFARGFDHIALCTGAGRPTVLPIKNGLAKGVRQASDFLMALQLTGAAKSDSIANLTVQLPVVVIGGGLTAIDTATEALGLGLN